MHSSINLVLFFTIFGTRILAIEPTCLQGEKTSPSMSCHCYCPESRPMGNQSLLEQIKAENAKLKEEIKNLLNKNSCSGGSKYAENFDLSFTNHGITDYVMTHGLKHDLSEFTLSLWMRTQDRTSTDVCFFSYATSTLDNSILLISTSALAFHILGEGKTTSTGGLNDGKWHHLAATWENKSGTWKVYKDGKSVGGGTGVKKGFVVPRTGTIVLGQEQDAVGGKFVTSQSFVGQLTQVNLWDKAMTQQEILSLSKSCTSGIHGNILEWNDSILAGMRGDVKVLRPSLCRE